MSRTILVTGATGKQGGAVINALLKEPATNSYNILAVTRDTNSGSAKKLASKGSNVKVVQGNLDDVPSLFQNAKAAAGGTIWGVYSVQISMGKGVTLDSEVAQGTALIDESLKHGVSHFVYSSVDRGGDERSWENPTPIDHFISKYRIEHYLRDNAGNKMGWTILRPVAFMDNLTPTFPTKVFLAALRNTLVDKPVQWIATSDIGVFAAKAFAEPEKFNKKAMALAGDELNYDGVVKATQDVSSSPTNATFWFLGSALMWGVKEMGTMVQWFADEGYGADISNLKSIHPGLQDMRSWLKDESPFPAK